MSTKKNYWFKRRRYGWGFTPVTWQGWLVVIAFLVLLVGGAAAFENGEANSGTSESAFYLLFVLLLVITVFRISIAKGPKPRWRWGKKPTDDPDEDF